MADLDGLNVTDDAGEPVVPPTTPPTAADDATQPQAKEPAAAAPADVITPEELAFAGEMLGRIWAAPFGWMAMGRNNVNWMVAAEQHRKEVGEHLAQMAHAAGWLKPGVMPPWLLPAGAVLQLSQQAVVEVLKADKEPLWAPKNVTPADDKEKAAA